MVSKINNHDDAKSGRDTNHKLLANKTDFDDNRMADPQYNKGIYMADTKSIQIPKIEVVGCKDHG